MIAERPSHTSRTAAPDLLAATERKQADEALRFQAALLDAVGQAVIATDLEGNVTYWNRGAETLFGWAAGEVLGRSASVITPPQANRARFDAVVAALRRGEIWTGEFVLQRRDGTTFPALVTDTPLRDERGEIVGLIGVSQDITERHEAEQHLRQLNTRLRLLLDIGTTLSSTLEPDALLDGLLERLVDSVAGADMGAVYLYDAASGYLLPRASVGLDPEAFAQVRLRPGESSSGIVYQTGQPLHVSASGPVDAAAIARSLSEGTRRLIDPNSRIAHLRSSLTAPLRMADGTMVGTLSVGSSTTALAKDDLPLVEGVASQAIMALQNARLYAQAQEDARRLAEALRELKTAEEQLVQQERLRALGEMASGIAHDFNNALAPVVGFSELLLELPSMLDDRAKALQYLKLIHTGAEDAAGVVTRLREFYRQQEPGATQPVDMGPLVEQVVALTQPRWRDQAQANGRTIRVETDLAAAPPAAGNASELRELLTNLIFNAVDAMPNGGAITISTRWEVAQTGQRRSGKHGSPNGRGSGRIALSVRDTGTGMSEETQRRCLEPFYTTKGEHGTGLGLSMVYGAVRRHGGELAISSALGEGTTITISLPIYTTPAASERAARRTTATRPLRILVVDDDADVRRVTQALLEADGHAVTSVSGGREALEALRGEEGFDLVITDRAMPDMSGDQVAETIKTLAPDMKLILLTGFGGLMDTSDIPAADAILAKPVTLTALRRTIAGLRPGDERAQGLSEGAGQPEEAE